MCLLISQPSGVTFSRNEILDFVSYNSDGFGIAYGDGAALHLVRMVGTPSEIWDTYRTVAGGKRCVLHFRMTTHGATDANNAHPYPVTDDIVVAHNGILSCGNPVDPCRSDTWHFVEYFLAPIARTNPDLLFTPEWAEMCGRLIGGSNKLAIVHRDGRIALVNEQSGVTYKGAWLSNTYAWNAPHKYAESGRVSSFRDGRAASVPPVEHEVTDYEVSEIWDTALERHASNQVDGLWRWAQQNPLDAAILLAAVSPCDPHEATEWLNEAAGDAITYLMERLDDVGMSQFEDTYAIDTPDYAGVN